MAINRKATANWKGTGKEGSGTVSTTSGVLSNTPHSFLTRFVSEDGKAGTNPEELVAAAHASCFTMAMSFGLNKAGFTADTLECEMPMGPPNDDVSNYFRRRGLLLRVARSKALEGWRRPQKWS